jgi:hypothetical protein
VRRWSSSSIIFRKWVIEISFLYLSVTHTIAVFNQGGLEARGSVRRASGFVQGALIPPCARTYVSKMMGCACPNSLNLLRYFILAMHKRIN